MCRSMAPTQEGTIDKLGEAAAESEVQPAAGQWQIIIQELGLPLPGGWVMAGVPAHAVCIQYA